MFADKSEPADDQGRGCAEYDEPPSSSCALFAAVELVKKIRLPVLADLFAKYGRTISWKTERGIPYRGVVPG